MHGVPLYASSLNHTASIVISPSITRKSNFSDCEFHYDVSLSIHFRLGPANTRLMQAYSRFDDRFSLLVPFVRLWVKYSGTPRTQLNNYAVSMMLIYSLQRCQPPVLPCLQSPGSWPKNMAWYGKHGFASSLKTSFIIGPWKCDFVPPESLLPSTNTQTPGMYVRML